MRKAPGGTIAGGPDSGAEAKCGKWGLGVASLDFQKRQGSRPSSQAEP